MKTRSAWILLALTGALTAACDEDPAGPDACRQISSACHDVDTGSGPLHDCHETGHDGDLAACEAVLGSCVAMCEAAEPVDGGHAHDEDAGHAHDEDAGTDHDGGPHMHAFSIRFAARAGDDAVSCGTPITGLGPDGSQTAELHDFRFYVHGIELLRGDGSAVPLAIADEAPWQRAGVALLDFEDRSGRCTTGTTELRDVVNGTAPEGEYTGVRFVLGVPFEQNHQDASSATAPLNLTALFWNWQGGYKFARIDSSVPLAGDARATFNVHLGSTGCDGSPATGGVTACASPNRPTVELTGFDPDTSVIALDYAQLVEGLDLSANTESTPPGCMSAPTDPECTEVFTSLGLPFGDAAAAMDAFRVITP